MKSFVAISSIFVFASTVGFAQDAAGIAARSGAQPASENFVMVVPAATCPVSLHALQGSGGGLLKARDAEPAPQPSQSIHLVLSDAPATHVISAKVVVRGLSGKNQMLPARSASDTQGDLLRTLDVRFVREGDDVLGSDLILPGFTSVRSIQIQSLSYQDGSTWTVAGRACSVVPDPLMLIAGH
jgi:hypothetical protein